MIIIIITFLFVLFIYFYFYPYLFDLWYRIGLILTLFTILNYLCCGSICLIFKCHTDESHTNMNIL